MNNDKFQKLLRLIPEGEEHAVSMSTLSSILGIKSRVLRSLIVEARRAGNIICSNDNGYFLPANNDELLRYYRLVTARMCTTSSCLKPVRRKLREEKAI